jgi:hypothetical protein
VLRINIGDLPAVDLDDPVIVACVQIKLFMVGCKLEALGQKEAILSDGPASSIDGIVNVLKSHVLKDKVRVCRQRPSS